MPQLSTSEQHSRCRFYFDTFLPGIRGQLLIEDLKTLTACFAIQITDQENSIWSLEIVDGRLVAVGRQLEQAPQCTFLVDTSTLLDIAGARIAPQEAFFDLKIALEGDMELGLTLSTVLAPFFARFPFEPEADA